MIHGYSKAMAFFAALGSFVGAVGLSAGTPSLTYTVLYSFCSLPSCADGSVPSGNLAALGNGNLYGTTFSGGTNNAGTVYQMTGSGFVLPTATAER